MTKAEKPKIYQTLVKQFPNAILAVASRSEFGHQKYADIDQDWQGFTRFPVDQYKDAIVRHLMGFGDEGETELDHAIAVAWNALAILEVTLRNQNDT